MGFKESPDTKLTSFAPLNLCSEYRSLYHWYRGSFRGLFWTFLSISI